VRLNVRGPSSFVTRCAALAARDFLAIVRAGSARERVGLLAPLVLPVFVHGHPGAMDDALALLTSVVLPTLAFGWGVLWARASTTRLRFVRALFPAAPRGARALVAVFALAGASFGFGFVAAVVAARAGAPALDALAVGRVAFAASFAFAGLGVAQAPRATALTLAAPLLLAALRAERGVLYALVPTTHAYALTIDPPVGLEARLRFAALLAFGAIGAIAFGLSPRRRSTAPLG
jgi:hypothetical protein